jgi:omega-hydroxy-beta-dihydromenaquinone-9 sulfotransferase
MEEFRIPPISTLAGSTILNYFKILRKGHIEPRFYFRIFLTTLIVLIATPFHIWEGFFFRRKLKAFKFNTPPVFILGHWRSGTTLLHNVLTKDPASGFITTYQSLFPNNMASKWLFRTFMKVFMPHRRPSDGVELNVAFPQEDEFAFSNCQPNAYYNFFYFPSNYRSFYEKSVHLTPLTEKEKGLWFSSYDRLLKKALIDSHGERLIIKNPVNTARIRHILKMYPDARFLYIYRNPITVFHSTRRFYQKLFPTLWLQKIDDKLIDSMIFEVYNKLLEDYLEQKSLIPEGNLLEIRFEDFERDPMKEMRLIYNKLFREDFAKAERYFSDYIQSQKSHKKNKYFVEQEEVDAVQKHLGRFIELYDYSLPPDVEIKTG